MPRGTAKQRWPPAELDLSDLTGRQQPVTNLARMGPRMQRGARGSPGSLGEMFKSTGQ